MNHYHIYEAIGRGKHSTVYKGRKKKTIEYYAIKSVDKSQKNKVLQEVRILHALDHPNILKFYSWHGTSAHIWLVLEYCVGGDLMSLLKQDSHLPEESIHDIGQDLVQALQYLHSRGVIYCDLKPSNILLDENGHIKLCDFGLARHQSEISETSTSQLPRTKRGTPYYMAPELFQDVGVHSYASDLWALGCVLYECFAGRPPFEGNEFTRLANSILSDPTPRLPGNPSHLFANLINCLLVKDPAERVKWKQLCEHEFWRSKLAPVHLPTEPAFDNMLHLLTKPGFAEKNNDKPLQQRTPSKPQERDINGFHKLDENSTRGSDMTVKLANCKKSNAMAPNKVVDEKQKNLSSAVRGVNLLRLSRIAKTNLQKENEKGNYRRALPKNSDNDAEVQIENNDMELNFSENLEEDGHDELDISEMPERAPLVQKPFQTQPIEDVVEADKDSERLDMHAISEDESNTFEHDTPENAEVVATPPSSVLQRKTPHAKGGSDGAHVNSSGNLLHVMWHPSDLSVRPVMPSRKGDRTSEGILVHFDAVPACEFVKLSPDQMDCLSSRIALILSGNSSISEKQSTIRYLETLSGNTDAANILTGGPIMPVLGKMLRQSKVSTLRVQLASVIGLLIRHATFIQVDLLNSGLMGALADGLRDKQEKMRRFSMAALGELLFYISTQNGNFVRAGNPTESPAKECRGWQVPSSVIALVSSVLRKGEDDTTQLYALRTVENICSQGGDWAARFSNQDVVANLCYIYKALGKPDGMRFTAGSCLVRLARFTPASIPSIMEKLSFKDTVFALLKGGPRQQQISLNLLNLAMFGNHVIQNLSRLLISLMEEKTLVPTLISLIEQESEVLRGKALIFVALVCKNCRRWLPFLFCNARLLSAVDRLAKEKASYMKQCMEAFVAVVANTVPGLLETVFGDVQQMVGGRRHGPLYMMGGRANLKTNVHLIPVILHLLGCPPFKHMVISAQVLQQLSNLIKLLESPFQGRDEFLITVLRILESITEDSSFLLEEPGIFINHILPSLSIMYRGNKDGDARFLCLKILFDAMIIFLNEITDSSDNEIISGIKCLSGKHFLPLYPVLIEDDDPIPIYAQKLLVMFIEFKFVNISDILHLKTVSQCFEFLLGDLSNVNVNSVRLCLLLASAPEMDIKILAQLQVVRKIGNLLEFVKAREMEDFLEPTLCLCKALILRSIGSGKEFSYLETPSLLLNYTFDIGSPSSQNNIRDIGEFGDNMAVLLELNKAEKAEIADLASECVLLLLKAAPREAATSLITNLNKMSSVLEVWHHGIPRLQVLRLLYAIAYSCRLCLTQGMILALPDITKFKMILSNMSDLHERGISDAAVEVALELQRLHCC